MLRVDDDDDGAFAMPCLESYEDVCASLAEFSEKTWLLVGQKTKIKGGKNAPILQPKERVEFKKKTYAAAVNVNAPFEEQMIIVYHAVAEFALALHLRQRCKNVPDIVEDARKNLEEVWAKVLRNDVVVGGNLATIMQTKDVLSNPKVALSRLETPLRHTLFGHKLTKGVRVLQPAPKGKGVVTAGDVVELGEQQPALVTAKTIDALTYFSKETKEVLKGMFVGRDLESKDRKRLSQRDIYHLLMTALYMLSGFVAESFRYAELSPWNPNELVKESEESERSSASAVSSGSAAAVAATPVATGVSTKPPKALPITPPARSSASSASSASPAPGTKVVVGPSYLGREQVVSGARGTASSSGSSSGSVQQQPVVGQYIRGPSRQGSAQEYSGPEYGQLQLAPPEPVQGSLTPKRPTFGRFLTEDSGE